MKFFTKLLLPLSVFTVLISSCVRQSFDIEPCTRRIHVEPEWINTRPVNDEGPIHICDLPEASGMQNFALETGRNGADVELLPGTYELLAWENSQNVTVDGRIVTVATQTRALALEPTEFSGGATPGTVTGDGGLQILYIPMIQQTRQLIIRINFIGELSYLIERVEAMVTGIAVARDINSGFVPEGGENRPAVVSSGEMYYLFRAEPNPLRETWYRGERMLLGIDGNSTQELQVRVTGIDGSFTEVTQDITGAMDSFQVDTNVAQPFVINLFLNLGLDLELTIENWEIGDDSSISVS